MQTQVTEFIRADREKVWGLITDFEGAADRISGIESAEVLERPADGLIGLKWRETRMMFGKASSETMWIDSAEPGHWYEACAESHGSRYRTRLAITETDGGSNLTMTFSGTPVSLMAKLLTPLSYVFAGSIKGMLAKDLSEIKAAAEA